VAKIKFGTSVEAEECIKLMEGRFFDGVRLECAFWDGKEDLSKGPRASREEDEKRLDEFGQWLETRE